jgi:hypothetical protein
VIELAEGVLDRVGSTETPQNPIAIVKMRDHGSVDELLAAASFVVVLDRIADPGNLGTILRSAEASGTPGSRAGCIRSRTVMRRRRCSRSTSRPEMRSCSRDPARWGWTRWSCRF